MKIAVFDTFVVREDGRRMHFDILVADAGRSLEAVLAHGQKYLAVRGIKAGSLSASECRFCHTEVANEELARVIARDGVAIIELENCD